MGFCSFTKSFLVFGQIQTSLQNCNAEDTEAIHSNRKSDQKKAITVCWGCGDRRNGLTRAQRTGAGTAWKIWKRSQLTACRTGRPTEEEGGDRAFVKDGCSSV